MVNNMIEVRGKRVLVCEDEGMSRCLISSALKNAGASSLLITSTFTIAKKQMREAQVEVIVTDNQMNDTIDGRQFVSWLKDNGFVNTPVIFNSNTVNTDTVREINHPNLWIAEIKNCFRNIIAD